jgi:hypothetical protein
MKEYRRARINMLRRIQKNIGPCFGCVGRGNRKLCRKLPPCASISKAGKLQNYVFKEKAK